MNRFLLMAAAAAACAACDSGDIWPEEHADAGGTTVTASVTFANLQAWPSAYSVAVAAFAEGDDYPLVSKSFIKPPADGAEEISLAGIPDEADYVSVCLLLKDRRLLYEFCSQSTDTAENETITMPAMTVDLLEYGRIQAQVFANCTSCHGGSSSVAAGLFLTEDRSYDALVGVPSSISDKLRVAPGQPAESFLVDVLTGDAGVSYDHTNGTLKNDEEDVELIESWIKSLK